MSALLNEPRPKTTPPPGDAFPVAPLQNIFGYASPGAFVSDSSSAPAGTQSTVGTTRETPVLRTAQAPSPGPPRPAPLPKQNKGRLLIALFMFGFVGGIGLLLWNVFIRFEAYGVIEGQVIKISAPWDGVVASVEVRDGDRVTAGQVLATLGNIALEQQLASLGDELRAARAEREMEICKLQWQARVAAAEHLELWSGLVQQQTSLDELEKKFERAQSLKARDAISEEQFDELRFAIQGRRKTVEKMTAAVKERNKLADLSSFEAAADWLKPLSEKVQRIEADAARLRDQLELGKIRAPVGGRIIKRRTHPGERVDPDEHVIELLQDDSLQVVVYVPQSRSAAFIPNQEISVYVAPGGSAIPCRVERIGDRLENSPPVIERYYTHGEHLLPVVLRPDSDIRSSLRLGSVVRLPRNLSPFPATITP